jgi:hypothetical protein
LFQIALIGIQWRWFAIKRAKTAMTPNKKHIMKLKQQTLTFALILGSGVCLYAQGQTTATPAAGSATANTTGTAASEPFVKIQGTDVKFAGVPPVTFHGFASQGFLISDKYNYLGDSTRGSFRFSEFALNASMNPAPRTRIAAQGFSYCVGKAGNYDVDLDYGLIEYRVADSFGIRAGRVRRQEGLYNHIQDLDVARTWVLLPQGIYPARWRDMYTTVDGGQVFGNFSLGKAGGIEYELYSGLQRPKLNGGLAWQKANIPPYSKLTDINSPWMNGFQLWYQTPVEGLRAGVAFNIDKNITFATANNRTTRGTPYVQHYSLEYLRGPWTFQAEYFTYAVKYHVTGAGLPDRFVRIAPDAWFLSGAYRFNRYVEVGSYYSEYYPDIHNRSDLAYAKANAGSPGSDSHQRDVALSVRVDPLSWWTIKAEVHMIQGTGQLYDTVSNPVRDDRWWPMLALKTTLSF